MSSDDSRLLSQVVRELRELRKELALFQESHLQPDRLLTPPEVARRLTVRPDRVYKWLQAKYGKKKKNEKRPRYKIDQQEYAAIKAALKPVAAPSRKKHTKPTLSVNRYGSS